MPSLKVLTFQLNPGGHVHGIQYNFTIKKNLEMINDFQRQLRVF